MHVLVSGAGIAGPTFAWWMARTGAKVTVVDISKDFLTQGQNIDLSGAAVTIVKRMGVEKRIREFNTTETGTRIIDTNGKPIAHFSLESGASPTSPYEILRGDLAMVLAEATKDHPNIDYIFNTTITNVIRNDSTGITVTLSNNTTRAFDLAIAADGQWSNLRKQIFSSTEWSVLDKNLYVNYFTIPRLPTDTSFWEIYLSSHRRSIMTRPDSHGTTRVSLNIMPHTPTQKSAWEKASRAGRTAQIELVKSSFADAGGDVERFLRELDDSPDFYMQAIKQIRMPKWYKNRVICLGDAAYAPTPLTGMGTPLAIIGAYCLAGELSKLGDGEAPEKAFEEYEKGFRPFVERIQQIPFFAPGIFHPAGPVQKCMVQGFIWTMAKVLSWPWVVKLVSGGEDKVGDAEKDDSGFHMPSYPTLDACLSQKDLDNAD